MAIDQKNVYVEQFGAIGDTNSVRRAALAASNDFWQ